MLERLNEHIAAIDAYPHHGPRSLYLSRVEAEYLEKALRLVEGCVECEGTPDAKDEWFFKLVYDFDAARSRLEGE